MEAFLRSIRRSERVMAVRTTVPLLLALVALVIHLALEVPHTRAAWLAVALDDNVVPPAIDVVDGLRAEMANRYSGSNEGGVISVDASAAPLAPALTAATDAALAQMKAGLADLRTSSESLAQDGNLVPCETTNGCGTDAIAAAVSAFRDANADVPTVLGALRTASTAVSRTVFAAFLDTAAFEAHGGLLGRLGATYVQLVVASLTELTALHATFHAAESFEADSSEAALERRPVESFFVARANLRYLLAFSDLPFAAVEPASYAAIITAAQATLAEAETILRVTADSYMEAQSMAFTAADVGAITSIAREMLNVARREPSGFSAVEARGLWVALAAVVVTLVCVLGSVAVSTLHLRTSTTQTKLLAELSAVGETTALANTFRPVLSGARTEGIPSDPPATRLGEVYDVAARVLLELRPFLSQSLFGPFVDDNGGTAGASKDRKIESQSQSIAAIGSPPSAGGGAAGVGAPESGLDGGASGGTAASAGSNPLTWLTPSFLSGITRRGQSKAMPWLPFRCALRADSAVASVNCTFLTVAPLLDRHHVRARVGGSESLLTWYSQMLATVVKVTNLNGGVVHSIDPNGVVVCVWNLMSPSGAPAATALRVARILRDAYDSIDMNLVSGRCMIANAKTGRRRGVVLVGSALEFSERVLLLNRVHTSAIVLDFDSYRDLSLHEQALCRPIAILHSGPTSRVVLFSADWIASAKMSPTQAKHYASAFALYQHGMFQQSLEKFNEYLRVYGRDASADWIVSNLLAQKLHPVETIVQNAQVSKADCSQSLRTLEDLQSW